MCGAKFLGNTRREEQPASSVYPRHILTQTLVAFYDYGGVHVQTAVTSQEKRGLPATRTEKQPTPTRQSTCKFDLSGADPGFEKGARVGADQIYTRFFPFSRIQGLQERGKGTDPQATLK